MRSAHSLSYDFTNHVGEVKEGVGFGGPNLEWASLEYIDWISKIDPDVQQLMFLGIEGYEYVFYKQPKTGKWYRKRLPVKAA